MSLKKYITGTVLAGLSGAALAAPITLPTGLSQLSDNNAEYLINADGSLSDSDPTLDEGDRLRGIFNIDSIESLISGGPEYTPFNGVNELTGIFDITVVSKTFNGVNYNYVFEATGNLTTAGAAVEMYYDPAQNYDRICGTTAECEGWASDGSLWAALGFGDNSFWTATTVTDNILSVGSISAPAVGGTFNLGLDFLVNNTGYNFNSYECLFTGSGSINDVCASGSLLGTGNSDTPFDSYSNVDFVLDARVPSPGTVSLLGLGLLGVFASTRRRARS